MALIVLGIAWLAGIYLGTWVALPDELAGAFALSALLLAVLWWPRRALRLSLFALVVLLAALARGQAALPAPDQSPLAPYADRGPLQLRGVVADTPYSQGAASVLRLDVRALRPSGEAEWQPASGSVLVRLPLQPARHYGDYLELEGTLETPADLDGFGYREYLARQGISALLRYPKAALLAPNQGWAPLALLHDLRAALSAALARSLPEPQAALAQGILLGQRRGIPDGLLDAFNRTNTSHVLAISGMHVTLLVGALVLLARHIFGRLGVLLFASLGIVAYALLVGTSPSVVRASLMSILFAVGAAIGRPRDMAAGLTLVAALMTLHNPAALFDLGFQLSFLATTGLVLLASPLERRLALLPAWLSAPFAASIAAQVATFPLLLLYSGQLSLAGPLANLLVPSLLPAVMLASAATAFGGLVSPLLGQLLGYAAWLFLSLMVWTVEALGALPWAALPVGRPGLALVVAYYALLAGYLFYRLPATTPLHDAWRALWSRLPVVPSLALLALAAVLSWSAVLTLPDEALRVSVMSVGNGDAILIRTVQHKILIDGGPDPSAVANALGRRLPFWDRGLDLVVLSHPNEDHLAGLIAVLERFPVRRVLDSATGERSATYLRWEELIKERGIERVQAAAGQEIDLGQGITLRVLHPPPGGAGLEAPNDQSTVLRLSAGDFGMLLTGDLGPAGAAVLLASAEELHATVLKVPHHGSRTALSEELLAAVSPEAALISVGQSNRFGHPAPETLELLGRRGVPVYRTDLDGTIEVVVAGEGYTVNAERRR